MVESNQDMVPSQPPFRQIKLSRHGCAHGTRRRCTVLPNETLMTGSRSSQQMKTSQRESAKRTQQVVESKTEQKKTNPRNPGQLPIRPGVQIYLLRNEPSPIFGHFISLVSLDRSANQTQPPIPKSVKQETHLTNYLRITSGGIFSHIPTTTRAQVDLLRNEPSPISGHFTSTCRHSSHVPHPVPIQATMESSLPPPSAEDRLEYVR